MPVPVEVGGDATGATDLEVGARPPADVDELSLHVAEEGGPGQAAVPLVAGGVPLRVGVHDEKVEPAVAVVVEPAQPSAHHREFVVSGNPEAERTLAKVQPDLRGDVPEANVRHLSHGAR